MQFALLLLVFIGICEVLALVFGLVGWRHTAGKSPSLALSGLWDWLLFFRFGRLVWQRGEQPRI